LLDPYHHHEGSVLDDRAFMVFAGVAVVGTMTYTAWSADIVFRVGLQNTGDLWSKTFSPPTSSGTADLNQHRTETITIPKGAPAGEFSIAVQYVGAVGVTEAQCVIAYVDNLQVK